MQTRKSFRKVVLRCKYGMTTNRSESIKVALTKEAFDLSENWRLRKLSLRYEAAAYKSGHKAIRTCSFLI